MSSSERYPFCPGIAKRQVHELVSTQAYYTFELMEQHRDAAPFSFEEIEHLSLKARRFHTGRLLEQCLAELVAAKALITSKRSVGESSEWIESSGSVVGA